MELTANEFYTKQLEKSEQRAQSLKKQLNYLALLRGVSFILFFAVFFLFQHFQFLTIAFIASGLLLLVFLFLVQKYFQKENELIFQQKMAFVSARELKALNFNFEDFKDGKEFINPNHDFSFDMDIFGKNSVFQMINRAETIVGVEKLADAFQNSLLDKDKIENIQKAVVELEQKPLWRKEFMASALQNFSNKKSGATFMQFRNNSSSNDAENWQNLLLEKPELQSSFWKVSLYILPAFSILMLILAIVEVIPVILFFYIALAMLAVVGSKLKYINSVHDKVSNQHKLLAKYALLLKLIENTDFESNYINEIKQSLIKNQASASKALNYFASKLKALDNRLNLLYAFISNALALHDLHIVRQIESWQKSYASEFKNWQNAIAEMEFLISLSTFAYNNPTYIFPLISEDETFSALELGHPLMPANKCVRNTFKTEQSAQTFIVTGANMAGKSTFLRTLGVNLILAQMGSVVFAESFNFQPIRLITSIRISDSLNENESYFYAELKRLHYIISETKKAQPIFIIIDEMLRGTNSGDKHKGSEGLMRKLTQTKCISFLATHDVALGQLQNDFPQQVKNYCFEAEIKDNELFFDYKLRPGISKNMNATFLMQKMQIID
jgi:DNA mismatch repair ATPase MutS